MAQLNKKEAITDVDLKRLNTLMEKFKASAHGK